MIFFDRTSIVQFKVNEFIVKLNRTSLSDISSQLFVICSNVIDDSLNFFIEFSCLDRIRVRTKDQKEKTPSSCFFFSSQIKSSTKKKMSSNSSSTRNKRQEEKYVQMIRDLVALPMNKQCFDCNSKGPTYVEYVEKRDEFVHLKFSF